MSSFNTNDNKSRLQMRTDVCEKILKRTFPNLKMYFLKAIEKEESCLVFVTRRCYILYQIVSEIEGWSPQVVVTDWGFFAFRKNIKECKRVLVIDDIGLTGDSIRNVLQMINKYVPRKCKIEAMLFAANIENINQLRKMYIAPLKSVKIKSYYQLTQRQCQELSQKLVAVILKCGMPYTTLVYPVFGKETKDLIAGKKTAKWQVQNKILNNYKWNTVYINDFENEVYLWCKCISNYACVRVYRQNQNEQFTLLLPFLFFKSVKKNKVKNLFGLISAQFIKKEKLEIAEYIQNMLNVKPAQKKEAMEYLMCFFSCFCTKNLFDLSNLSTSIEIQKDVSINSIKGSFTEIFLSIFKDDDTRFFSEFWKDIDLESLSQCFYSSQADQRYDYPGHDALKKYINKNKGKNAFDLTCELFNFMQELSKENKNCKSIAFEELFDLLKNEGGYNEETIYLAQIECWDRGIATYSFSYSDDRGLYAKCSVGEISSLIFMIKYNYLLRKFYEKNFFCEDNLTDKQRRKNLHEVIADEKRAQRISDEEEQMLYKLIENQKGKIYNLFI